MTLRRFHHPDLSLPVVRRRITEEILFLAPGILQVILTRGRSLTWSAWPRSERRSCHSALSRLKKAGLVVTAGGMNSPATLSLTPRGEELVPAELRPEKRWRTRWDGIWYLLAYDVPEDNRIYRDRLRTFLQRVRMGCLQRSIYVTPFDMRPSFDDMTRAAGVGEYAFLFESRTVLGLSPAEIVRKAWDFERLREIQKYYIEVYNDNLNELPRIHGAADTFLEIAREEMAACRSSLLTDPLLPSSLCPPDYLGQEVWRLHKRFETELAEATVRRIK